MLAGYLYSIPASPQSSEATRGAVADVTARLQFLCGACIGVFEARVEEEARRKRQAEEDAALLTESITWGDLSKRAGCAFIENWLVALLSAVQQQPTDLEYATRVVGDVRTALQQVGLDAVTYGSRRTGLVVSESDFDFTAIRCPSQAQAPSELNVASGIKAAGARRHLQDIVTDALKSSENFAEVEVIHAKVPLVRCLHQGTHATPIDFSFSNLGIGSTEFLLNQLSRSDVPLMRFARPLIVLTKLLLLSHKLHDANHGGLGSYAASMLVLWFLRQQETSDIVAQIARCPSSASTVEGDATEPLVILWMALLQYYGSDFDSKSFGLDPLEMKYIPANKMKMFQSFHPQGICIRHPTARDTNAANGCTKFQTAIRALFRDVSMALNQLGRMKYVMKTSHVYLEVERHVFQPVTDVLTSEGKKRLAQALRQTPICYSMLRSQHAECDIEERHIFCGGLRWW